MVTDQQVRRLLSLMQKKTLAQAAAEAAYGAPPSPGS